MTFPRVNSIHFETNTGVATHLPVIVPKPPRGRLIKINWWSYILMTGGGAIQHSDNCILVEGETPRDATNGEASGSGIDMASPNAIRETEEVRVLDLAPPPSGITTTSTVSMATHNGFRNYQPAGIITAYELRTGFRTGGGVEEYYSSVGFEIIRVTEREWLDAHKINSRRVYADTFS